MGCVCCFGPAQFQRLFSRVACGPQKVICKAIWPSSWKKFLATGLNNRDMCQNGFSEKVWAIKDSLLECFYVIILL